MFFLFLAEMGLHGINQIKIKNRHKSHKTQLQNIFIFIIQVPPPLRVLPAVRPQRGGGGRKVGEIHSRVDKAFPLEKTGGVEALQG